MKIAIFDYKVIPTNPIGGCHLRLISELYKEHDITVFAVEFENPCPERIKWVRIPLPTRPLVLLFLLYHLFAPIIFFMYSIFTKQKFDLIQMVESKLLFGDVSYSQFCHRAYLKKHWKHSPVKGIRGILRWTNHALHSLLEPIVYRKVKQIIVPSKGLKRELIEQYPFTANKILVIPNPIDLEKMQKPKDFDRDKFRANYSIKKEDIVLCFIALGHFERKGLPLLLKALNQLSKENIKLFVVGGEQDLIKQYKRYVQEVNLANQVIFVGMQRDVRPFLWCSDAFIFPSLYETFSLVSFEAAAAGLPIIVTPLYGVEDYLVDKQNGILVGRNVQEILNGINYFLSLSSKDLENMKQNAIKDTKKYSRENFLNNWRDFYKEFI